MLHFTVPLYLINYAFDIGNAFDYILYIFYICCYVVLKCTVSYIINNIQLLSLSFTPSVQPPHFTFYISYTVTVKYNIAQH